MQVQPQAGYFRHRHRSFLGRAGLPLRLCSLRLHLSKDSHATRRFISNMHRTARDQASIGCIRPQNGRFARSQVESQVNWLVI
jgi:hypothetical protein